MPNVCEGRSESTELKIKELDTWGVTCEMLCFKRLKRASLLKAKFHWWKSPCVTTRKDVSCLSVHSIKVVMWGNMFIRMTRSSLLHTAFTSSWISFLFPSFSSSKISTTAFKTCRVSYGRVNVFFLKSWLTFISPAKKLLIASLFSGWNSRSSRSGNSDRMSLNINTQYSSYLCPALVPIPCLSCKAMWKGMEFAQAGEAQLHLQ